MTDRTTKVLLLAIAVGLWAHLGTEWFRPVVVQAQVGFDDSRIVRELRSIQSDVSSIHLGLCLNDKLC